MSYGSGWFASVFKLFQAFSGPAASFAPAQKYDGVANIELPEQKAHAPTASEGVILDTPIHLPAAVPTAPPERDDRRDVVRNLFNDYWNGATEKPATFAERLDVAEDYINNRLAERNAGWRLDTTTRKQLGLPRSAVRS
jgi:hypothetical protein